MYEACTAELEKNDVFALDSPMFQRNINGIESTGVLVSDFHGDNRGSNPLGDANDSLDSPRISINGLVNLRGYLRRYYRDHGYVHFRKSEKISQRNCLTDSGCR